MLSNKAMLVHLGVSQWVGRRLDKRATGTVEASHSTEKRIGNFTKKLLPGAKQLEKISTLTGAMRKMFYDNTLPWLADGTRIISSKNYLEFTQEFKAHKVKFESSVSDFLQNYPTLREEAKKKLGDLFLESDYPSAAKLQSCFKCEISFFPMPDVKDFRTELLDSEKDAFLASMKKVESAVVMDCYSRLYDVVKTAADKLADPKANFRESLLSNVGEICAMLPKLNITDDPGLEKMRVEVDSILSGLDSKTLKTSATDRDMAARQLKDIESKMSAFMGSV
jgi:hypothetical protein